jgi:hypothetical protein
MTLFGADALAQAADSAVVAGPKTDAANSNVEVYHITPSLDYLYTRPRTFDFVGYSIKDLGYFCTNTFQKKNWAKIGILMAGTGILFALDQSIIDEAQRSAKRWHIPSDNKVRTVAKIAGFPFYLPNSTGSALYYLGDGTMHFFIAGSFLTYGLVAHNNRALQTTSQLMEGMITVGIITQFFKHITGHECPSRATAPGGVWRPFPNQIEYHKHVSQYDAFPSGHLATAMVTVTVIADNYPGNKFIRPIGYTLMTVLGFQMLNNGVHWASDYPVGIAIGYSMAKVAISRGRQVIDKRTADGHSGLIKSMCIYPTLLDREGLAVSLQCVF